ncbi:probable inactive receptor kinase At5g10020 [Malania oleifera]|uniref:probable inactive receptor kinase At5g10020 n=1 Tax=Malania oleifera TaxID=397392 RepID=UPI0025AE6004|nr:probable inactive receptor kinase At5g10020 [Malania oleifera]
MQATCFILLLLIVLGTGESDLEALLELKKGIKNDPFGKVLVSWNPKSLASDGCPQNWYGISCSNGRVTSITLNDEGLVGEFHFSAITSLKMLHNLSVSNNQLTGTISEIGSLVLLEFLDLSGNSFHGLIPSGFTNLKNLVLLNLSSNNFQGTTPAGFGKFEQLKHVDLRSNAFSGDIMHLLSQLGSVVYVDLSNNQFCGSLDLGIGNSSFVSTIQYLNVSHNSIVGELFAHDGMPYFDSLEVFDASNNGLVGAIPSFNFVVSLRILRLGSNRLLGSLPEGFVQESSMVLSELDLSLNQLEGPVGSITSATLKKLNLSSNKLSGSLPAKVGHCAIIDLSNNMLSGNLSRIRSWGNYVEVIQLSSNALTGTLPNQTSQFLRLTSLEISNNSLEGVLPPHLGTYPELEVIDLSLNKFSGFLPPSLFSSTRLCVLNLSGNNLIGPIPLQAITDGALRGSMQNLSLVSLDLSHNSLSDHLPEEISQFHNLVYLNLSGNHFDGRIPDNLPDELKAFDVSYNNLSGVVPQSLRRFPDSAFHPGNSLLLFSYSPSTPKDVPDLREHKSHMKPAIRAALITGLATGAAIIALLSIMIYYRSHWQECDKRSLEKNGGSKGIQPGDSSLRFKSAPGTNMDPSLGSFNLPQDHVSSSKKVSAHEYAGSSSRGRPRYLSLPEVMRKDKGEITSPGSLLSSSNPSPSENQFQFDNPGVIRSPDKLVGDLHLFDGSFLFTAEELSRAPAEVIGRSCHGTLYKAEFGSGHVVTVKWLRDGIAKGRKEFAREAKKLGSIRHPNLVSLQGYYWGTKEHEKLIISNYVNAPCLAIYLQETQPRKLPPLSLHERLKIAIDVARCLKYLHNERAIPHGNLKSTNILVQSPNLNALLTDYSLHRLMTPAGTAEQVLNAAALGYRPPEFANSSRPCPSLKSDVYAFGVVFLELLTGRISGEIISGSPGGVDLTDWVRLLVEQNCSPECFDRLIRGVHVECPPKGLDDMLQVALRCILPASERPDMKTVFEDLSLIVL